jgi:hypothetical protein
LETGKASAAAAGPRDGGTGAGRGGLWGEVRACRSSTDDRGHDDDTAGHDHANSHSHPADADANRPGS